MTGENGAVRFVPRDRHTPALAGVLLAASCLGLAGCATHTTSEDSSTPSPSVTTTSAASRIPVTTSATRKPINQTTRPSTPSTAQIRAQIATLTKPLGPDGVSIAALDVTTGRRFSYGAAGGMTMGSTVKLLILEALLLRNQDAGTWLSDYQQQEAVAMIENSDNDDADELYNDAGALAGMNAAAPRLGLRTTVLDPGNVWGLSYTSAADQLQLLKNLVTNGPLNANSRNFAMNLMQDVEADQAWGASAAGDPGSVAAIKNGWLGVDRDGGRWLANTDGILTVKGHTVLMSVLTQHNSDYQTGVDLVERLAKLTAGALFAT